MISVIEISSTLSLLDSRYNTAGLPNDLATLYSKLAIIELCGWIEVSMDIIAQDYIDRKITTQDYRNCFERDIRKKNNGFLWNGNFKKMLLPTIGIQNVETINTMIPQVIVDLERELENLQLKRNDAAHTNYNATKSYDSPSIIIAKLAVINPLLVQIENLIVII